MKKASDWLSKALPRAELLREARAQIALQRWEDVVGTMIAARVKPDRFDRGTLYVVSESSSWAQELHFQKEVILQRLNSIAGEDLFTDLRSGRAQHKAKKPTP